MKYLVMALFLLAVFDVQLSSKRMKKYGFGIELNGVIRALSTILGPEIGCAIGIGIPVALQILLCVFMDWQMFLAFLVGYRAKLAVNQYISIKLEAQMDEIRAEMVRRVAQGEATPSALAEDDSSVLQSPCAPSQKDSDENLRK